MKAITILTALIFGLFGSIISPAVGASLFTISLVSGAAAPGILFASFFNPAGLDLPDEGVHAIGEVVFTAKFVSPKWSEFMDIERGIKAKKQLIITGHFQGLVGSVRTDCDITPNPGTIGSVQKKWDPAYVSDRFEECYEPLLGMFWKYMLKNGIDKADLTQSDYDNFIQERLMEYINDDFIYQKLFFTKKTITAGGTNNIQPDELKYFNMIDGVLAQLAVIEAATPARRITCTENAGATYLLQAFATASPTVHPATDYLNSLIYGASMELRGATDPIIICTQSIADQYARERKAVTNIEMAYLRTETGIKYFEIDGVMIMPIFTLDRLIKRHFDNGTVLFNPHFSLYTTKTNIRVGTEEEKDFTTLSSKYDAYHKKWFCDFALSLDVKIVDDNLCQMLY